MKKKFSIILPIYGNEKNLPITVPYIIEHLNLFEQYDVEIIMVCDGSPDNSYEIMKQYQKEYPQLIKIAVFTRNFGQGAAIHCGLEMASGDVMGVISADLQDPFELFVDMLTYWEQGYKLVIATREDRPEKGFGGFCSRTMHKIVHKYVNVRYPRGGFDFYLMDKCVANSFIQNDAPNGSVQMLLMWLGYEYKEILYTRKERELGKSTWTLSKKLNAASGLFVTYSQLPIRISFVFSFALIIIGIICGLVSLVYGLTFDIHNMVIHLLVSGLYVAAGMILGIIGIIGEYIWRMFDLQKGRPRFVVREKIDESKGIEK